MPKKDDSKVVVASEEDSLIITKEGLKLLEQELEELKGEGRKRVAARLKEAISFGDLSENSEYEEAKNEQAFIEGRIIQLEHMIKNAKVVDEKSHSKNKVEIGTKVKIRNSKRKTEEFEWTIVGSTESDPFNGRISNEAPAGMALMGAKAGDKISVQAPNGKTEYEVLKLS
jgi:transcription elongation factor GreA